MFCCSYSRKITISESAKKFKFVSSKTIDNIQEAEVDTNKHQISTIPSLKSKHREVNNTLVYKGGLCSNLMYLMNGEKTGTGDIMVRRVRMLHLSSQCHDIMLNTVSIKFIHFQAKECNSQTNLAPLK